MSSNTSATAAAVSPALTTEELEQGRLYIRQSRDGVLGATKGLSQAQWNFKSAADRWSIAEILEHVVFVQEQLAAGSAGLLDRLESTPDLRALALEAMPLKAVSQGKYESMDGYQWLLTAAAHTERHTKQILEVKACVDFPIR